MDEQQEQVKLHTAMHYRSRRNVDFPFGFIRSASASTSTLLQRQNIAPQTVLVRTYVLSLRFIRM